MTSIPSYLSFCMASVFFEVEAEVVVGWERSGTVWDNSEPLKRISDHHSADTIPIRRCGPYCGINVSSTSELACVQEYRNKLFSTSKRKRYK